MRVILVKDVFYVAASANTLPPPRRYSGYELVCGILVEDVFYVAASPNTLPTPPPQIFGR